MTPQDELKYLTQLVLEASRWRVSEDQAEEDPIRLEITQRINTLQGVKPEVIGGRIQSVRERGLAKQKSKLEKRGTIRIAFPDGSYHRVKLEDVEQVPCMQSPTGYKNIIKEGRLDHYFTKYGITMRGVKAALDAKENN